MKNIASNLYHHIAQYIEDKPDRIIFNNVGQSCHIELYYSIDNELGEVITTNVFEKLDERIFVNE